MGKIEQEYGDSKILYHSDKFRSFLEDKIIFPLCVRVKPTNKCNHKCFDCVYEPDFSGIHSDINRNDEIPRQKMLEILSDFRDIGVKAITYSGGGEPLIYPHIEEALEKTIEYGINLSIITNGQKLNRRKAELLSNAHWVRASVNSIDSGTFSEIRKRPSGRFNELIKNLKNFAKIKNPKNVFGINFVVNHLNKDSVYSSAKFFKEIGVNNIKFTPAWKKDLFFEYHEPFRYLVEEQIKKAREELVDAGFKIHDTYEKDFSLTGRNERTYKRCYYMQIVPVIGADCNVYFCHNKAYDGSGLLGSIKNSSFKDLWFSQESNDKFKQFNPMDGCRHQCTNDVKNIKINFAINAYKKLNELRSKGVDDDILASFLYDKEKVDSFLSCYGDHLNFI